MICMNVNEHTTIGYVVQVNVNEEFYNSIIVG